MLAKEGAERVLHKTVSVGHSRAAAFMNSMVATTSTKLCKPKTEEIQAWWYGHTIPSLAGSNGNC